LDPDPLVRFHDPAPGGQKNTDLAAPDTTWAFLWTLNPKIYTGTSSIRTVPKHKLLKLLFEKDCI
jgi:hypothetical protein